MKRILPVALLVVACATVPNEPKDQVTTQGRHLIITLPPTEWDRSPTRITLDTNGGRVRELQLAVPYKPHQAARDQLLDLFKAKWGLPEEVVEDSKATLVFRKEHPRVEIREDAEHGAWSVSIR